MGKELSKMTLEELWELFPIFLVAPDDRWKDSFNEIEKTLTGLLSNQPVVRISHIGSTAIQGIWAKNIVDVMVEIPQSADMKDTAQILEQNGFTIMSSEANRILLNKGYTEDGYADKVNMRLHLKKNWPKRAFPARQKGLTQNGCQSMIFRVDNFGHVDAYFTGSE